MRYIGNAFIIAILVLVGGIFLANKTEIMNGIEGEYKTMDIKKLKSKIMKWIGIIAVILGLAFEAGAFLAHLQGIVMQIVPLAVTGCVCIIAGVICSIYGKRIEA